MRAWNTSGYSLFVTWKMPAKVNGKLKGYQVYRVGAVLSVHVFVTEPAITSKLAFVLSIPIFRILGIELELACTRGLSGEIFSHANSF